MRKILFESNAFEQYIYWQTQDKKTLKKINQLLVDIDRSEDGKTGLGHPEPLKGNLSGWWSREIDEKNRLVYKVEDECIKVFQCKNHYGDK